MDRHSLTEMIGKLMINSIINGRAGFQWDGGALQANPESTCRSTKPAVLSRVLVYTS